jgi:hypothetical protein
MKEGGDVYFDDGIKDDRMGLAHIMHDMID